MDERPEDDRGRLAGTEILIGNPEGFWWSLIRPAERSTTTTEFLNCAANAFASRRCTLSGQGPKVGDVCGEEFSAQARSERRAYPARGSVRSEQRRLGRKEPPPEGLRRIWPGASMLVGDSPTGGGCSWCPCGSTSRLAPGQIGRNKRHRIYALDHLAHVTVHNGILPRPLSIGLPVR